MDRYKRPLRFTLLWAAHMVVIVGLDMVFGFSQHLPLRVDDVTSIYCVAGAALAAIELTIWDHFHDNSKYHDPWE